MMFCWQARARLADMIEGRLDAGARKELMAHLSACAACAADLARTKRVTVWLAEAAGTGGEMAGDVAAPPGFEGRLMAEIRRRSGAGRAPAAAAPARFAWRPIGLLPVAATLVLMLAASLLATRLHAPLAPAEPGEAALIAHASSSLAAEQSPTDLADRIDPPREIPFTVREDLVGARRGRIPVTTYVLDPAPEEGAVIRASF